MRLISSQGRGTLTINTEFRRGGCPSDQLGRPGLLICLTAHVLGSPSGHHLRNPIPPRLVTLRAVPNAGSNPTTESPVQRTLYGSRTTIGQELLRLLLDSPDVGGQPQARNAAPDGVAAAECLVRVASLVRQVTNLMEAHPDRAALTTAMTTCQERVNQVRSGGGSDGRNAAAGLGPGALAGAGGGSSSETFGVGSGKGGTAGARTWAKSGSGGAVAAAPWSRGSTLGDSSSPPSSLSSSASSASASASASSASFASSPSLSTRSQGPLPTPTDTAKDTAKDTDPRDTRSPRDTTSFAWEWRRVKRVVVLGLGSLAAYQSALRSGRQTERESTRAAARLYQLALSMMLTSPAVLPGFRTTGAATRTAPTAPEDPLTGLAGASSMTAPEQETGAGGQSRAVAVDAGAQFPAKVLYFDPEYLGWDVALVESLCRDCQAADDSVAACVSQPSGQGDVGAEDTDSASVASQMVALTSVIAAASAAPPAALVADTPTLFYAPCCPRELYDEIVRCNLAAGTLQNVALVGNSLRAQSDAALLLRAFGGACFGGGGGVGGGFGGSLGRGGPGRGTGRGEGEEAFVDLVAERRVVEVMLPDFAAHGVATALHLFA